MVRNIKQKIIRTLERYNFQDVDGSPAFRLKNFDVIRPGKFLIKVHVKEFS